jgi:pimeloyl-ACP methyl ester carboxylesterase
MNDNSLSYRTKATESKDGTRIVYREYGKGPGLVLVQGSMGTMYNFHELAELLARHFTVYTLERRGRGESGPLGENYTIQKEIEDIDTVLTQTNTHFVFGLSSGAIISLHAAQQLKMIEKLAIFEPPLFEEGEAPLDALERYESEINQNHVEAALVAGMKAGKFGPAILLGLPNSFLERMTRMMLKREDKKGTKGYESMRKLAYALKSDFIIAKETIGKVEQFKSVTTPTLLIGATMSPTYLKKANDMLEAVLPNVKRVTLNKVGHAAAWNSDQYGAKPSLVADELINFFSNKLY